MKRCLELNNGPSRCKLVLIALSSLAASPSLGQAPPPESVLQQFKQEATALRPSINSAWVGQFLANVDILPAISPRAVLVNKEKRAYYLPEEATSLPEVERGKLEERALDETFYYTTRYGTPLAYSRALDLVAASGTDAVSGKRILDYGYGAVGHLRLLATLGADVVGVEVDPLLKVLYSQPEDQGVIKGKNGLEGRLHLVHGRWPAEEAAKTSVGGRFDLIISKNTLKNGYIHPAQEVDPRMLVNLGVDDETYVRELFAALNPGGKVMIYNICPAPAPPDQPYIPWADGRSPFSRELYEKCGFRVLSFDQDDSQAARDMGHALGWDQGESPMDLKADLFAWYTLVERPLSVHP